MGGGGISCCLGVWGEKLALSSEGRFNNSGKKIMEKESVLLLSIGIRNMYPSCSFFLFNDTLTWNVRWRLGTRWNLVAQSIGGGAAGTIKWLGWWGSSRSFGVSLPLAREGLMRLKRSRGVPCPKQSPSYVPDMATLMFPVDDKSWSWKTEHDSFPH